VSQYHAFSNGKVHAAYDPETMTFCRLNDGGWEEAQRGVFVFPQAAPRPSPPPRPSAPQTPADQRVPVERLVLILTTICNLRCRYCYAAGGSYGLAEKHMPLEVASRAIDWALDKFSFQIIQFFGGEPALTPHLIEFVCREINQRIAAEPGRNPPRYGLVTNGVQLSPEFEEIIRRYGIGVTVSIDGPAEVHDQYRVHADGRGSFKAALANFHKLRDGGKVQVGTEMTLTPHALAAGQGVWELVQFSANELQLPEAHIVPVCFSSPEMNWDAASRAKLIESYRRATLSCLQSLLHGRPVWFSVLSGVLRTLILRRERPIICSAGSDTLAIDPEGDLYPCFMFAGQPGRVFGNVMAGVDQSLFRERVAEFFKFAQKEAHPRCRACWAKRVCSGCVGSQETSSGRLDGEWEPMCEVVRAVAEEAMLFLAEARETPEVWQQFVSQYKLARSPPADPC